MSVCCLIAACDPSAAARPTSVRQAIAIATLERMRTPPPRKRLGVAVANMCDGLMRNRVPFVRIDTPLCQIYCLVMMTDLDLKYSLVHRDIRPSAQIANEKIRIGREDAAQSQRVTAGVFDNELTGAVEIELFGNFAQGFRFEYKLVLRPRGGCRHVCTHRFGRDCACERDLLAG